MNWKSFTAMLARDSHVARRNFVPLLIQTLLQPMLLVFVFGRIMTQSGLMQSAYKSMLLPGVIAISMVLSGVQAVALPLITEFQFTKEIEDRLLAPMGIAWLAVEKVIAGMIQALVSGLVVLPAAWLLLGRGVEIHMSRPLVFAGICLLVSMFASSGGLTLGCSVGQTQIGLMFSMILAPMMFFGCAYYPWSALATFPILKWAVLINPLVYASEGFRGALVPQFPHIPMTVIFEALTVVNILLMWVGMRQFQRKAIG